LWSGRRYTTFLAAELRPIFSESSQRKRQSSGGAEYTGMDNFYRDIRQNLKQIALPRDQVAPMGLIISELLLCYKVVVAMRLL
jgi:hypothetical protein